jgi:hypothetical protein
MEKDDDVQFLKWLISRLIYRYSHIKSDNIIFRIENVIQKLVTAPKPDVTDDELDKIISKYYVDFYLDKGDSLNIGYTRQERNTLREQIRCLVIDVMARNIPKDTLIKGN